MNRPASVGQKWGGVAAAIRAELFLYLNHFAREARFHWFTHFYVGGAVALLVVTIVARRTGRPVPLPLLWPILGHVVAIFPDFLFEAGIAHQRWMDVFPGHLSSRFIPGRDWTWYGIFLGSLAVVLWTVQGPSPQPRLSSSV